MSKNTRQAGAAQLPDAAEQMRLAVIDLELKARYWKANHDIMFYSLRGDELIADYEALQAKHKEREDKAREQMREKLTIAGLINEDGSPKSFEELTDNEHFTPVDEDIENQNVEGRV